MTILVIKCDECGTVHDRRDDHGPTEGCVITKRGEYCLSCHNDRQPWADG